MKRNALGLAAPGTVCGTSWVFAGTVYHRVVINRESVNLVAKQLGIPRHTILRIARMTETFGGVPSKERLAVAAMAIPDATDEDIGDWFGMTKQWAEDVRRNADEIREDEYIPPELDVIPEETDWGMPSAKERARIAAEIRRNGLAAQQEKAPPRVTAAHYSWNGAYGTFLPVGS